MHKKRAPARIGFKSRSAPELSLLAIVNMTVSYYEKIIGIRLTFVCGYCIITVETADKKEVRYEKICCEGKA